MAKKYKSKKNLINSHPRILWIDALKGLSIGAVVLNHLFSVAYDNEIIKLSTAFAVPVFILLSGITLSLSFEHHRQSIKYIFSKFYKILILYIIISLIYHLLFSQYSFSAKVFLISLLTFSASGPLYFFAIYLQLLIVLPLIYKLFDNLQNISAYLLCVIFTAGILMNKTDITRFFIGESKMVGGIYIEGLILGANKIFGGSYLSMFVLGIYIFQKNLLSVKNYLNFFLVGILGVLLTFGLNSEKIWSNPPNLYTMGYSLSIFAVFFSLFSMLSNLHAAILRLLSIIGRNSLYIFLLHSMFIFWVFNILKRPETGMLTFMRAFSYFILMYSAAILAPILVFLILLKLARFFGIELKLV